MNILLTGAAGFIGSNLASKLLHTKFETSQGDFLSSTPSEGLRTHLAEQHLNTSTPTSTPSEGLRTHLAEQHLNTLTPQHLPQHLNTSTPTSTAQQLPKDSEIPSRSNSLTAFLRYNSRADIGLLSLLPREMLDQIEIILGDLRDPSAILEAARDCDLIYHLGALISIPYSYLHPVETVQTNILGTLNILEAARQLNIPVVHTSTSEVYGTAQRVPIDETHPLQGQSPYSASKIGADKLVESYYRSFGVPTITVRPFNTYGPGQSARAVIPTIITQALTQNHLNLGSLDTKRDFTYIDDTVQGFLKAGQALLDAVQSGSSSKLNTQNSKLPPQQLNSSTAQQLKNQPESRPPSPVLGQEYNLGTGTEVTIGQITHLILQILNKPDLPIIQDPARLRPQNSEVQRLLSDNTKAKQALGWTPTIALEEGLERTIAWISDHLDRYRIGIYER